MPLHNLTFTLTVLALFTTAEKAAEIEGDLLEQSQRHGKLWLLWQVKLTSILLFLHALRSDAAKLLLVGYAVYELILKLNWWLLNPVRWALGRSLGLDRPEMILANHGVNAVVVMLLGWLAVRISPRNGSLVLILAIGMMLGRIALLESLQYSLEIAAFALIPAFAGMLLAKWLELNRQGNPGLQQ